MMIGIEIVKPHEAADHMGCFPGDGELSALIQKKCFEAGLIPERGGQKRYRSASAAFSADQ